MSHKLHKQSRPQSRTPYTPYTRHESSVELDEVTIKRYKMRVEKALNELRRARETLSARGVQKTCEVIDDLDPKIEVFCGVASEVSIIQVLAHLSAAHSALDDYNRQVDNPVATDHITFAINNVRAPSIKI